MEMLKVKNIGMNKCGACEGPMILRTEWMGPCIAVCIAWKQWAVMFHSSHFPDDDNLTAELLEEAFHVIPEEKRKDIKPFVCGGDLTDPYELCEEGEDPAENTKRVTENRRLVLDMLKNSGFAEPYVRWNEDGESTSMSANLNAGKVFIRRKLELVEDMNIKEVALWPIRQD